MSNDTETHPSTHTATGRFQVTAWDERTLATSDDETVEISGTTCPARGFSRADVTYAYSGDVEGTGLVAYLIAYRAGATAPTTGFQQFTGSIDGHDGSLVLQHVGEHDAGSVRERLEIVEGLGTGGLAGMTGHATVEIAGHSDDGYPVTVHYRL